MEKVLKSGKKVVVRELTALDEILAYQLMGKDFDVDNVASSAMLHRSVSAVIAIDSVDDEKLELPQELADVYATLGQFKAKEWREVLAIYDELNGFGQEELGE